MVSSVGSDKFVEVFSHDKSFVTDAFYNTWDDDDVDFFAFWDFFILELVFFDRIEDNLHDFFGYWEELDTLVDEILFQKRSKRLYFLETVFIKVSEGQFLQFF